MAVARTVTVLAPRYPTGGASRAFPGYRSTIRAVLAAVVIAVVMLCARGVRGCPGARRESRPQQPGGRGVRGAAGQGASRGGRRIARPTVRPEGARRTPSRCSAWGSTNQVEAAGAGLMAAAAWTRHRARAATVRTASAAERSGAAGHRRRAQHPTWTTQHGGGRGGLGRRLGATAYSRHRRGRARDRPRPGLRAAPTAPRHLSASALLAASGLSRERRDRGVSGVEPAGAAVVPGRLASVSATGGEVTEQRPGQEVVRLPPRGLAQRGPGLPIVAESRPRGRTQVVGGEAPRRSAEATRSPARAPPADPTPERLGPRRGSARPSAARPRSAAPTRASAAQPR